MDYWMNIMNTQLWKYSVGDESYSDHANKSEASN